MKSGEKIAQGSQTAFLSRIVAQSSAFTGALFSGHFGVAAGILAETGLENTATRLFTSETGKKFLTEGFKIREGVKQVLRVGGVSGVTMPGRKKK